MKKSMDGSQMKKILFLTPQIPYPPISGGTILTWHLIKYLAKNYRLDIALLIKGNDEKGIEILKSQLPKEVNVWWKRINIPRSGVNLLKSYFYFLPLSIFRNLSFEFKNELKDIIRKEKYDFIFIDHWLMYQYVPYEIKSKVILHEHNAEYIMWERASSEERNWIKKMIVGFEAKRVKNYERKICRAVNRILCVTELDIRWLEQIGISREKLNMLTSVGDDSLLGFDDLEYNNTEKSLLHIGTMSWEANVNGILWFTNEIWPCLKNIEPNLKFYIVGKNPPQSIIRLNKCSDIIVTDFVKNIEPYYQKCRVFIAPLKFGSGIKVKILNAMARGIPIVTTPIGVEGINVRDGIDIMVGTTPDEIISKVIMLLNDKEMWTKIKDNARKTIQKNYTWDRVFAKLDNILAS